MKIAGIIAEYNPFHNGHAYQIEQTRRAGATHVAVAMSGSFVQRGEAAMLDKWTRTRAAIEGGADLVVELPTVFATAAANRFARAGVFILNQLLVDMISFGSECGDINKLKRTALAVSGAAKSFAFSELLSTGVSYPRAIYEAVCREYPNELSDILKSPNNILAIEYINAISEINNTIVPFTVERVGAEHDSEHPNGRFASASYLRQRLLRGRDIEGFVPASAFMEMTESFKHGYSPILQEELEATILYKLRNMSKAELCELPDVCEGFENRLFFAIRNASSVEELYSLAKTKRYTLARIRRIICAALLGIRVGDSDVSPQYIRVLGANSRGNEILKAAKKTSAIPISPKAADLAELLRRENSVGFKMLGTDFRSTDISVLAAKKIRPCGLDFTHKTVILP